MRILKSSDWQYCGVEGEYFRFKDKREAQNEGCILLTKNAKYVIVESNIVIVLTWTQPILGDPKPKYSFSYETLRRRDRGEVSIKLFPWEYLSLGALITPIAPTYAK
jgi:hypothetical protein